MNICFYAPFKPLGHKNPSGDLVIATGLYDYLTARGHTVYTASALRTRWIYFKPWLLPVVLRERRRISRFVSHRNADLWFTFHSYYKAPDILGPSAAQRLGIPYVIFQGIYATKRRKKSQTWPGFMLNKMALNAAHHVFVNKQVDYKNLIRLKPADRVTYVAPGIYPDQFYFDTSARERMRHEWQTDDRPVIVSAAMFRPDVKTRGLIWMIKVLGRLRQQGRQFQLVIAGDGGERPRLIKAAEDHLPGMVRFVGKQQRNKLYRFYSAGDIFVFPGIGESLGMVYLEAQSCGLPVVALDNAGIPEVVQNRRTGILTPMLEAEPFIRAIDDLLSNDNLRRKMGRAAQSYVREKHDLNINYRKMDDVLQRVVQNSR
jgi:glycosyltransferase involved in cell wall biosynthesis